MSEIQEFIDTHNNKVTPLKNERNLAYWNAQVTGKEEFYKKSENLTKEIQKHYSNKENFEKLKKWYNTQIEDLLLKRQIDILYHSFLSCQGDIKLLHEITEKSILIDKKFNTFRCKVKGKELTENEIREILKKETNSEILKEAWESHKEQGQEVIADLLELVKLRNKKAKSLGFDNYYEMSLEFSEQTEEEITEIFNKLKDLTNEAYKKTKEEIDTFLKDKYKVEKVEPWHYQDIFLQLSPKTTNTNLDNHYNKDVLEIAKKFYKEIGFETQDIIDRSSWYEQKGKCQHAFSLSVDREGDIRILQNTKNNERWMETTLHELGHAIYSKNIPKELPIILRDDAHTLVTESIAMFFGRLPQTIHFLNEFTDLKDNIEEELNKSLQFSQIVFSRWAMLITEFEKNLYKNPDQDLNKLWYTLTKEYQLIDFYRDKPDWAAKIHFTSAPIYYHNYLLGELLASQLHNFITKNITKDNNIINKKEISNYLKEEIFSKGCIYKWNDLIELATKEKLNPEHFVNQFTIS